MDKKEFVYLKTKHSNILKCYKSEQMNKPIYHPVESKTNCYVDWNDVEKIFTIDDFYKENTNLKQALNEIREYINNYSWGINSFPVPLKETIIGIDILQIIDKEIGDDE